MALSSDSHQLAGQSEQSRPPLNPANRLTFFIGLVIVLLSLAAGFATYAILTGLTPIIPTHGVVVTMLLINVVLVLAMIGVITWQVRGLWIARRRQAACKEQGYSDQKIAGQSQSNIVDSSSRLVFIAQWFLNPVKGHNCSERHGDYVDQRRSPGGREHNGAERDDRPMPQIERVGNSANVNHRP